MRFVFGLRLAKNFALISIQELNTRWPQLPIEVYLAVQATGCLISWNVTETRTDCTSWTALLCRQDMKGFVFSPISARTIQSNSYGQKWNEKWSRKIPHKGTKKSCKRRSQLCNHWRLDVVCTPCRAVVRGIRLWKKITSTIIRDTLWFPCKNVTTVVKRLVMKMFKIDEVRN